MPARVGGLRSLPGDGQRMRLAGWLLCGVHIAAAR
jgi:hypothetical protein